MQAQPVWPSLDSDSTTNQPTPLSHRTAQVPNVNRPQYPHLSTLPLHAQTILTPSMELQTLPDGFLQSPTHGSVLIHWPLSVYKKLYIVFLKCVQDLPKWCSPVKAWANLSSTSKCLPVWGMTLKEATQHPQGSDLYACICKGP